jgi:hypothetical protein
VYTSDVRLDNPGLDFERIFREVRPQVLAVRPDDRYESIKLPLCEELGCEYVVIDDEVAFPELSTSRIVSFVRRPKDIPLRVDFAGGWLDVPMFAREGGFILNCSIQPTDKEQDWPLRTGTGLGAGAAWAIMQGQDALKEELEVGVGWQDPAILYETGLCLWKSGQHPELVIKKSGASLEGRMAVWWTGQSHKTIELRDIKRDFAEIVRASRRARDFMLTGNFFQLVTAISMSYRVQVAEGMDPLPISGKALAMKYCGSGYGGYALYLFASQADRDEFVSLTPEALAVEPFLRAYP